jgi:VWFA-related protein
LAAILLLVLVAAGLLAGVSAQTPSPQTPSPQTPSPQTPTPPPPTDPQAQQQPRPVFRAGTDLVRVDIVVLDKHGVPVPSLTADDFEIQEDGARQEIRTFQYVKADGNPSADDEVSLTIRSRSHAAMEAAKDNVRVFLIFWDEYHIGQVGSANRARVALMNFVRTAFGPTDIVAFMDPLTTIDSLWFTRDRLELAERVRKLVGRSGVYLPTRSAVEDAQLERGDVERLRSEVTVSALKSAVVHLGGLRDGRKSLLLVSEGPRGIMRDGQALLTDLVRTANDNNTAIYSIDPRGFGTARFPSLFDGVAEDTGGQALRSNDIDESFRRVVTQASGFYLIGYAPTDAPGRPMDGRFHKIKVKVKPSNLDVRARSGYWAPSVSDIARAKAKAAEYDVPPDIARVLSDLPGQGSRRAVDLWMGATIDRGESAVRVSWLPRASAPTGTGTPATVGVVGRLGDKRVFEGTVDASGASFPAPAGSLKVTVTVENTAGEVIDRDVRSVDVPDPAAPVLSISSPTVFRTQNARELRMDRGPSALPFPGREFLHTDRVLIRFGVYGGAATTAKVTAKILSQWGKDLTELTLTRVSPDDTQYELDLPLGSVARGDFVLAFTATTGAETTRAFVPIRVVR